jgi:bifunctional non-homologous end joining protein LigD
MGLQRYHAKRDFRQTPEPRGARRAAASARRFVIQKHAARRLHYDFRLELDGVLKSWAVPKGPSLDPSEKRLAVHVEDHPVEYGDFEGVIPQGRYGGGRVLLWERGEWTPEGDPGEGYRKGRLRFRLEGSKLHGSWSLVRMGRAAEDGKENWLLIKSRDEHAREGAAADITALHGESVVSGRVIDAVGAPGEATWRSDRAGNGGEADAPAAKARTRARPARRPPVRASGPATVAGIALTHPDKVLFPGQGLTKRDLALYYERIADWIVPHLEGRPLTLVRCPQGAGRSCFYHKHLDESAPAAIDRVKITESGGRRSYAVANGISAVVGLAQIGVLELHTWGSRWPRIESPDRMIFDLDPDPALAWPRVVEAAQLTRALLEELGLRAFVKTTGGKGLHVVVPLLRKHDWDEVKAFSQAIARHMAHAMPERFTAKAAKRERAGKIYVDWLRNARGATAIAAYSTRARAGAPVSTPLFWEELSAETRPERFHVGTVPDRIAHLREDPWAQYRSTRQSLTASMRRRLGLD